MIVAFAAITAALATFFLGAVTVSVMSRAASVYRQRYFVQSYDNLSDLLLMLEKRQLRTLAIALGVLGLVLGALASPILAVVLCVAGLAGPKLLQARLRSQRIDQFEKQLADALTTIAGAMRSGLTFRQAMNEVAQNTHAPLGQEFKVFVREMQLGTSLEDALESLTRRVGSQELDLFVSSANIALKVGGNLSEMFDKLATTLRERFRIEGRIRTLTAQGKLQGWIIGFMPIVVWVGFDYFRPDLTRPMMEHWFGFAVVGLVIIMEVLGALVIRRIVEIEI